MSRVRVSSPALYLARTYVHGKGYAAELGVDLLATLQADTAHEDAHVYRHMWRMIVEEIREQFGGLFDALLAELDTDDETLPNHRINVTNRVEVTVRNTKITVAVTHRGRAETIFGVDVVYHIEGRKVLLFQHKKADRDHQLPLDAVQLEKIKRMCSTCPVRQFRLSATGWHGPFPPPWYTPGYIQPTCVSLYVVNTRDSHDQRAVSACRYEQFRKEYNKSPSFVLGLPSLGSINEAFVACYVGFGLAFESGRGPADNIVDTLAQDDHLIFEVFFGRNEKK